MSIEVTRACWLVEAPPTPKFVLIALADFSNESGECWPSIEALRAHTGLGRTAVIEAIKWLEGAGLIVANRSNGRHTTYRIDSKACARPIETSLPSVPVEPSNQIASRTGPAGGPVRQADGTGPADGPHQSVSRTGPVREADTNHQEPPRTTKEPPKKKARESTTTVDRPEGVDEQVWADWLTLRKSKKAPVTVTVLRTAEAESAKARMSLNEFLTAWCASGWQGFKAEWIRPHHRGLPGSVPVNADFSAKTYEGDTDDELPDFLRAAG